MGFFNFFNKQKKETLDNGLAKTKESVFGKIARAVTESISNLMNEISYDTISSAADKAEYKVDDMEHDYGKNSYVAAKARKQLGNFKKKQADDFTTASDNRKATMQKNDKDRHNGKRTYTSGVGWRTAKS